MILKIYKSYSYFYSYEKGKPGKMILNYFRRMILTASNFDGLLLLSQNQFKMASKCLSSRTDSNENLRNAVKYKPTTHVIFDMDGLLLDTETIYKRIISEMTQSYGKEYTTAIQLKVLGTTEQNTAEIVVKECNLPVTVEEFIKEFQRRQKIALANSDLMEGAEQLIRHFYKNNIPIAIATSSSDESVKVKIAKHTELFSLFNHFVMGSSDPEVKNGKPAPDIFKVCADRFKDKPKYEKCLVFEDAPNGVTGAVAAGMQTVMVPDKDLPSERTKHATLVLKSLLDFRPELFGLPAF